LASASWFIAFPFSNYYRFTHGASRQRGEHGTLFHRQTFGNNQCQWVVLSGGQIGLEKVMTRSARIGLAAALLVGGATIATAQNGPPTGGYPPARWNPNLYGYYGYHHRHDGYHHRYYAYHPRYHHHRHWYRY
jgi:hypothetical protein